ncbi:major facilitator superfamily domain-containing protein 6 isoform X2 [Phlebotomus argentipes]|uniref:major facilitator superfamily domain-containing protein 6 isoform X2 n=1 Tax=Phlebotomus argentipes TaxID=94469 RepID=UPI002893172A|nr:major facilitator superfamily domain-containing protein 6 isoform X2 [Phlebotomus argentipes]
MENMRINRRLLPLKSHYFLFNAGTAPIVPFMPTIARQLGFSTVVVGTVYTILPIMGMLAKPTFGAIADRFQRQKLLFLLFLILTAVSFFAIMFIPPIPADGSVDFHCSGGAVDLKHCPREGEQLDTSTIAALQQENGTLRCDLVCSAETWMWDLMCDHWNISQYCRDHRNEPEFSLTAVTKVGDMKLIDDCLFIVVREGDFGSGLLSNLFCPSHLGNVSQKYFKTPCRAQCDNAQVEHLITETSIANRDVTGLYQFWLLFIFLVASWVGMAVVVSVGDAICFEMLDDQPHLYGNQRLWGAVGWGTFSIIAGLLVDKFSEGQITKDYSVVFYMMLILLILDMVVSSKLEHTQTKLSTNIIKDVGAIFASVKIIIFFLWCVGVGLCTALVWNFLFWHLEDLAAAHGGDHLEWIKTLQGLAMGIQCFGGELPFFFLSGWILKKIGHIHAMSLVLLGFGLRFLLYSALTNPWWVLPIELLNGITFGIFYSTMASYASIVAPPGTEATLQGLVGAVFEGVGVSMGSLIAGILFAKIGGSLTFRYFGLGALLLLVLHVIVRRIHDRFAPKFGPRKKVNFVGFLNEIRQRFGGRKERHEKVHKIIISLTIFN